MIAEIDFRIAQWALWCLTGRAKLGYPTQAAFLNGQPRTGSRTLVICDDEAMQIQRAINTLDRKQRRVVDIVYFKMRSCTMDLRAKELRTSRQNLYRWIEEIHFKVRNELMD